MMKADNNPLRPEELKYVQILMRPILHVKHFFCVRWATYWE